MFITMCAGKGILLVLSVFLSRLFGRPQPIHWQLVPFIIWRETPRKCFLLPPKMVPALCLVQSPSKEMYVPRWPVSGFLSVGLCILSVSLHISPCFYALWWGHRQKMCEAGPWPLRSLESAEGKIYTCSERGRKGDEMKMKRWHEGDGAKWT